MTDVLPYDPRPERGRPRPVKVRAWPRRLYKGVLGAGVLASGWLLQWLPGALGVPLGRFAGSVGSYVSGKDRRRALANTEVALGRRDARLVTRSFGNIGASSMELIRAHRSPKWLLDRVEIEGREYVDQARAAGNGVVWITGHIGNWELMAMTFAHLGYPMSVIATRIRYPILNNAMIRYRKKQGIKTIERGSIRATKEILRAFRANELIGFLIDQDTRVPSVSVPFFGRPARTPVGAAELSIRMGAPAVAGFIIREGSRHRVVVHPPVFPPEGKLDKAQSAAEAARLTAEYTAQIEAHVVAHPADWAWMHRRWADVG